MIEIAFDGVRFCLNIKRIEYFGKYNTWTVFRNVHHCECIRFLNETSVNGSRIENVFRLKNNLDNDNDGRKGYS